MSVSMLFMVALIGVLLVVVVMMCYRLWKLRQVGGTAAILRDVPAVGGHGWRHGVMRYHGGEAGFYRLSSIRWWPDRTLSRRGLEIVSRADAAGRRIRHHDRRNRGSRAAGHGPGTSARLRGGIGSRCPHCLLVLAGVATVASSATPHVLTCCGCTAGSATSTSPSGLATRDRMNSRSDSRLRYFAGSTLIDSP